MRDLILAIRLSHPQQVKARGDLEAIREKSATYDPVKIWVKIRGISGKVSKSRL